MFKISKAIVLAMSKGKIKKKVTTAMNEIPGVAEVVSLCVVVCLTTWVVLGDNVVSAVRNKLGTVTMTVDCTKTSFQQV